MHIKPSSHNIPFIETYIDASLRRRKYALRFGSVSEINNQTYKGDMSIINKLLQLL